MVKITALMVLKCTSEASDPVILANATDLSSFGFFQRPSVKEFIVFVGRTVARRTPAGQRQSVQHEGDLKYPRGVAAVAKVRAEFDELWNKYEIMEQIGRGAFGAAI